MDTKTPSQKQENITNKYGQSLGIPVPNWEAPNPPAEINSSGNHCRLELLSAKKHAIELYTANAEDASTESWTYLPYGPFTSIQDYTQWLTEQASKSDQQFYAIIDLKTNKAVGLSAFLRISPPAGSIEVGHLKFSPLMQRTPISTEAMYLMMKHAFELGYRRYEWKCNDLNQPSRSAAKRLGFQFEGIFRQALIVKEHNRDTAWFSVIDSEWPALAVAFEQWLSPMNFNEEGVQVERLSDIRDSLLP